MKNLILLIAVSILTGHAYSSPFIIGGESPLEEPKVLKSTVSLVNIFKNKLVSFCTGTVINSRTVVTAAHCLADSSVNEIFIASGEEALKSEFFKVVRFKFYFKDYYRNNDISNRDIAILITERPLPFQALKIGNPFSLDTSTPLILAGYGIRSDSKMDTGILKILRSSTFSSLDESKVQLNEQKISRSATGDSGGPIFVKFDDELQLHGVLSSGGTSRVNGEIVRNYSNYTHPAFFIDWMNCALPTDQKIQKVDPNIEQKPCDEIKLKDIKDLINFKREQCQSQKPGYDLKENSDCLPVTRKACEEQIEETSMPLEWNEENQSCDYRK